LQLLPVIENGEETTLVGGQAVLEGVMMRSPHAWGVAVRKENGEIVTHKEPLEKPSERKKWLGWPLVRGLVTLGQAMTLGYRALQYSVNVALEDAQKEVAPEKRIEFKGPLMYANLFFSFAFMIVMYKFIPYGVSKETETIDYDELDRLAREHNPKMIVAGASAYSRLIDFPRMAAIAKAVGALFFVDMAHIAGLVAGGMHPSPVPHADFVSTTTHKTLRGPRGGLVLCKTQFAKELDRITFPGTQGGPLMHIIAAKAVCLKEAADPGFSEYAKQIVANARRLAAEISKAGFRIVTGGTDNHLFLIDLYSRGVTGKDAQPALDRAGITVNKNSIPFDPTPPMTAGGIRLGTPAVTTRGMREADMERIAAWIAEVLSHLGDAGRERRIRAEVAEFASQYPLYNRRWEFTPSLAGSPGAAR